jgi:hypothetical protein
MSEVLTKEWIERQREFWHNNGNPVTGSLPADKFKTLILKVLDAYEVMQERIELLEEENTQLREYADDV